MNKKKILLFAFFFIFYAPLLWLQEIKTCVGDGVANCGVLEVSNKETVHLTFPTRVKYVDLGSSFFTFKLDTGVNVVKIKAKQFDAQEITNLTVLTEDNFLYSFKVKIVKDVRVFTYVMQSSNVKVPVLRKDYCYLVLVASMGKKIFSKTSKKIKVTLLATHYLEGKYVFTFSIINQSKIPYEIESLNLGIKKTRSPVRQKIATQETILYPESSPCNPETIVNPGKELVFSLFYPKFYPPNGYHLFLYVNEKMEEYARSMKKKLNFKKIANMKTLD